MEERVGRPEKLPLTAVVMTFNEAGRIRKCLRSLSFAGELIVVDSGSTDGTREIASQEGARVVERAWPGDYADQRNFGDSLASFDWILQLDADEQVSPEMEEELKAFFSSPREKTYGGGRFPRKEIIFGKWVRGGGWYPQYKLRL
ncbi:MAG: glycosyltransferase family 2 protein, partial [Deltaproteobacteria bacterium]